MRRYWYDFEFLEDGVTIDPISIGIVDSDDREYYAVFRDAPWQRIAERPWLMENVVPHLPMGLDENRPWWPQSWLFDMADPCVKPKAQIAAEVKDFLIGRNEPIELWGYYPSYDHVALAQLWGPMIARPQRIPMWTNDVQQVAYELDLEHCLPRQGDDLHNALADAKWTREAWRYLVDARARLGGAS